MKKIIYIFSFVSLFIYSCGDTNGPPTNKELRDASTIPTIKMDMDENLLLAISIKNFSQPLPYHQPRGMLNFFDIKYLIREFFSTFFNQLKSFISSRFKFV